MDAGGFLHHTDPFAVPENERSPARRLRGRLPAPVTLWTAEGSAGPAGLTVSSLLIADGDPGLVAGIVDEESEFWVAARESGRFAVAPLRSADRQLADRFAGLMPAPGGVFTGYTWSQSGYGPVLRGLSTWVGCVLASASPLGYGLLVTATIDTVILGPPTDDPLLHHRGRYVD